MPRVARKSVGGMVYHVLNRANSRRRLFGSERDYLAFLAVLGEALRRWPGVRLLAFCIMPNHWHLVLWPTRDGELSEFMRWLTQTHTQRWRHARHTVDYGALYQGRYKSFVVQADRHLLILCRYVERNARRARLVDRATRWRWGSTWWRAHPRETFSMLMTHDWPVQRPRNWNTLLDGAAAAAAPAGASDAQAAEEELVQTSIARNRPLGGAAWVQRTARRLGMMHTLRPPGRPPRKSRRSR